MNVKRYFGFSSRSCKKNHVGIKQQSPLKKSHLPKKICWHSATKKPSARTLRPATYAVHAEICHTDKSFHEMQVMSNVNNHNPFSLYLFGFSPQPTRKEVGFNMHNARWKELCSLRSIPSACAHLRFHVLSSKFAAPGNIIIKVCEHSGYRLQHRAFSACWM